MSLICVSILFSDSLLVFILTADCNFSCSYCLQKKEKITINNVIIEKAVDFFYPFLKKDKENHIAFYGGEPLLAFEQMQYAVCLLLAKNKTGCKKIEFSVTTNGSLLTDEISDYFNRHKFVLILSFDGLTQDKGRKKDTLKRMVRLMKGMRQYPDIRFEINSVFAPHTIADFSESLRFIIEQGGSEITFNISTMEEWEPVDMKILERELQHFSDFLVTYYKKNGIIPVRNFRDNDVAHGSRIFRCSAGQKSSYSRVAANYADLRQDFFSVEKKEKEFCFLCKSIGACAVCPVNAAYSSGSWGTISGCHCRLIKIQRAARGKFLHTIATAKR